MDALLVRIAERITSGADPLLSPSEALELARLPESATLDILSVAGLARRRVYLRDHQRQVRALP